MTYFKIFVNLIVFFFIFLYPLYANLEEPLSVKGIISEINSYGIILKSNEEKEYKFLLSEKSVFVKNNKLCLSEDFKSGDEVYCYFDAETDTGGLLALVDTKSCEELSFIPGEYGGWVPAIEKVFYGQKLTLKGSVKQVLEEDRIMEIYTENNVEERLYIMNNVMVFDREKDCEVLDFSPDIFPAGTFVEVTGYNKEGEPLKVFCIEKGKFSGNFCSAEINRSMETFTGVISSLSGDIIEVEGKSGEKWKFRVTSHTIIFDWNIGDEGDFSSFTPGCDVKVESIPSMDCTGEAVVLEIGDPELYY